MMCVCVCVLELSNRCVSCTKVRKQSYSLYGVEDTVGTDKILES